MTLVVSKKISWIAQRQAGLQARPGRARRAKPGAGLAPQAGTKTSTPDIIMDEKHQLRSKRPTSIMGFMKEVLALVLPLLSTVTYGVTLLAMENVYD